MSRYLSKIVLKLLEIRKMTFEESTPRFAEQYFDYDGEGVFMELEFFPLNSASHLFLYSCFLSNFSNCVFGLTKCHSHMIASLNQKICNHKRGGKIVKKI